MIEVMVAMATTPTTQKFYHQSWAGNNIGIAYLWEDTERTHILPAW